MRPAGGGERHADRHARLGHGPERRQRAERRAASCCASRRWTASSRSTRATSRCARSRAPSRSASTRRRGGTGCSTRPIPARSDISTIGGNVAENSGGLRGLKYGVTRDYVMGLEVVLARRRGRAARQQVRQGRRRLLAEGPVHRHRKGRSASSPRCCSSCVPRPAARRTMLALVRPRSSDAADTVSAIIAARIIPCTLEFLDRMTVRLRRGLRARRPADRLRGRAADGNRRPPRGRRRRGRAHGGDRARASRAVTCAPRATTPRRCSWLAARRNAFAALARVRPTTILEDVTVPRSELAAMVASSPTRAAAHQPADRHVRPHGRRQPAPDVPDRRTRRRRDGSACTSRSTRSSNRTLELGGTITGEHGVGLAKKPWLRQQMGDASFGLHAPGQGGARPEGAAESGEDL